MAPFAELDFIYTPSSDVAADAEYLSGVLGGRLVFAIEAFGARVALVELAAGPPHLLLADHLSGERPVLVYRVENLEAAVAELERRGYDPGPQFGIPHGPCHSFATPGGHRLAIYEETRPGVADRFVGRRDF